ncbi:MAG: hypothetical protein ABI728_11495, partial [Betaproteobacteria bacterium]
EHLSVHKISQTWPGAPKDAKEGQGQERVQGTNFVSPTRQALRSPVEAGLSRICFASLAHPSRGYRKESFAVIDY